MNIDKIITYNYNQFGNEFGDTLVDLKNENERLHNIIKEVREYIENNEQYDTDFKFDYVYSDKILEILDKENKE